MRQDRGLEGLKFSSERILQAVHVLEVKARLSDVVEKGLKKMGVTVSKPILAIITLIFGILVILIPQSLSWIVGIYLIIQGALLLTEYYELQSRPASNP
jgi:uncharacterized membrane protein HdeD (DUF308 family)